MRWFIKKTRALLNGEHGIVAPLAAVFITGFVGLVGAAVDMGIVYSARSQLQSAADSSALAAASELVSDLDGDGIADSNYYGSEVIAKNYVASNVMLENNLIWTAEDTYEAGLWDFEAKNFSRLGDSANPADLTAVRVTLKRTVRTFFARILGISNVNIEASTTSYLGYAGDGGKADVPIAVQKSFLSTYAPSEKVIWQGEENAQWTTFSDPPANSSKVRDMINNPNNIPPINIGDTLYMMNGMADAALKDMQNKYNINKNLANEWHVVMPVVDWVNDGSEQQDGPVVGFVHFVITDIKTNGNPKYMEGYWLDGGAIVAEGASHYNGNSNWGARASRPALIN
jgi:Flp pilus assembly protein TadG